MNNTIFTVTTPHDTTVRMIVQAPNRRAVTKAINKGLEGGEISRNGTWYDIHESYNQEEQPQHTVDQCGRVVH